MLHRRQYNSRPLLYQRCCCLQSHTPHLGQSDHISLFLTLKYSPLIKRVKPTTKTVKVWMEDADPTLQDQLQLQDFFADAIKDSHTNIHTVAKSVMDNLNVCAEGVTTHKTVKLFHNQKPWMNKEVRLLLKARDAAFRSGDQEAYSSTTANLRKGISRAKHNYKERIEEHFNSSDPRRMWQGLHTLTNKSPCNSPPPSSTSLPDELNHPLVLIGRTRRQPSSQLFHQTRTHSNSPPQRSATS